MIQKKSINGLLLMSDDDSVGSRKCKSALHFDTEYLYAVSRLPDEPPIFLLGSEIIPRKQTPLSKVGQRATLSILRKGFTASRHHLYNRLVPPVGSRHPYRVQ
ncbi:unnamed protein product [Arctia plantaginis]|uniref:Uncharacterized protein n=1 Tax=Arctia plantaginis TaxID=874455 RepID=A0A8S1ARF5_ARCPL|nr:unnamed protein product [Arctia plantaginis]